MIELLTLFGFSTPPGRRQSTLSVQAPQAQFAAPAKRRSRFSRSNSRPTLRKFDGEKTFSDIRAASVRLRKHDPRDRQRQNYPAFRCPMAPALCWKRRLDPFRPSIRLAEHDHSAFPWRCSNIREPGHEVVLNFSGVRWTMYVDGELPRHDFRLAIRSVA